MSFKKTLKLGHDNMSCFKDEVKQCMGKYITNSQILLYLKILMELHADSLLRGKSSCPLPLVRLPNHQSLNAYNGSWVFVPLLSSLIPLCPPHPQKRAPLGSMISISSLDPGEQKYKWISSISVSQHLTQFPNLQQFLSVSQMY